MASEQVDFSSPVQVADVQAGLHLCFTYATMSGFQAKSPNLSPIK